METQPTIVPDDLIGRTIGNYIVRHKLGEGDMGLVYVAEHPSIGKRAVLKVLHAEFASQPEIVSRLFNEAKAVNDIQHPNIVEIIDFGTIPPSVPTDPPFVYFIMEYIEGASLTDLINLSEVGLVHVGVDPAKANEEQIKRLKFELYVHRMNIEGFSILGFA
jgi:eukaryotic-like serine/threonine-protein kinase